MIDREENSKRPAYKEPDTFDELVQWATWKIVAGITQGRPLIDSVYVVLHYAAKWFADHE